ncbi:MAG: outer membrane lipoprotein-sorting protein [Desulfotalea sp.]
MKLLILKVFGQNKDYPRLRNNFLFNVHFLVILLLFIAPVSFVYSDDFTAQEIMELVDKRDDGDRSIAEYKMLLIDRNGGQRSRTFRSLGIDKGEDRLALMFCLAPGDVKGTGFLTYDYEAAGKIDDQWLYLPALKKVKLIASADKSSSFMGSDFNYSDFTKKRLSDYTYEFYRKKPEVTVYGKKCWVIESTPKTQKVIDETGYTQTTLFVRQDNHVVVRAIYSVKGEKARKYFDVKTLELIDGIWTAIEIHMIKKKGKKTIHKTVLTFRNVQYNQDTVNEELFTTRQLEKGL